MHSVLPRTLANNNPLHQQRPPRKSTSFLSLRREKSDRTSPEPCPVAYTPSRSASKPTYFEAYPKGSEAPRATNSRSKGSVGRAQTSPEGSDYREENTRLSEAPGSTSYPFPSTENDVNGAQATPKPRARSKTGPSSRQQNSDSWIDAAPTLRLLGPSTQHSETSPDTPLDAASSNFPVLVSAPASGVETMDALVEGMNGGDFMASSSRNRFGNSLGQPPLPVPPPGIILGGAKVRRSSRKAVNHRASFSEDDEEDDDLYPPTPRPHRRRRPNRSTPSRGPTLSITPSSSSGITPQSSEPHTPVEQDSPLFGLTSNRGRIAPSVRDMPKTVAPSISEIIRAYAPPEGNLRSKPSLSRTPSRAYSQQSHGHATVREESEPDSEALMVAEDTEAVSRSSIDSIADEVLRTLKTQTSMRPIIGPISSFTRRQSTISDNTSLYSPRSDGGAASIYASSITSHPTHSSPYDNMTSLAKQAPSQAVAQYLRSARLTTLLKLTRSPHASQDNPLTVSLSDLGSPSGFPVVVFLGLGCVRHIMGLYDEMADCLGLRLITIDRWGLGRTEPRSKSAKGIIQWASVVEEVLDLLHIDQCSIMAHSAGAPYALSFANKLKRRIRGDICLLAPWVGGSENGNYKWLKYVPNGLLKTAQAAEWKLQAWMIGKPPTIAYEGIGYTANQKDPSRGNSPSSNLGVVYPSSSEAMGRPSMASSNFSEYDDLGDFDGRFESRSTLGAPKYTSRSGSESKIMVAKRKNSRGFLERLKGSPSPQPESSEIKPPNSGRRLKALRSMGSLKSKSSPRKPEPTSPQLPPSLKFDGLGLDDLSWAKATEYPEGDFLSSEGSTYTRVNGRRSMSFSSPRTPLSLPSSPTPSHNPSFTMPPVASSSSGSYQAALGNALIAASHAESAKGAHVDLLQILNHENHPWGFSYSSYPHNVRVWYGDKDEKIAEDAVRWMEKNMGEENCTVKVVKGADHGLMYKSGVVVEVLEQVLGYWQNPWLVFSVCFHFLLIIPFSRNHLSRVYTSILVDTHFFSEPLLDYIVYYYSLFFGYSTYLHTLISINV
ncbi:hypothetical protein C8J56DRAFT_851306 [Mycena floridula]|nr:hypothetical protein C8J56DRAFT_851306 [Mycena floridula]